MKIFCFSLAFISALFLVPVALHAQSSTQITTVVSNQIEGTWHALGQGNDRETFALAIDETGNLYAGGSFAEAGGIATNHIAMWDGATWHALGDGIRGDPIYNPYLYSVSSLAIDPAGNLYAGGDFSEAGSVTANNIAMWDGATWHALENGVGGFVSALALDKTGNLYVGGNFWHVGGVLADNIAMWDGATWHALGEGIVGSSFNPISALAIDKADNLYVGGNFTRAGNVPATNIAMWDGATWHALGQGVGVHGSIINGVYALAIDEIGNLYAGGSFAEAGGIAANHIAMWDGATWHALGDGISREVYALAIDKAGNLYAGGSFAEAGGVDAHNIAMWDGATWHALGQSNAYPSFYALAIDETGNLYTGGYFTEVGGVSANSIAVWIPGSTTDTENAEGVPALHLSTPYPNPVQTSTTFTFTLTAPEHVRLAIYDALGRKITTLMDAAQGPGEHQVTFDASRLSGGVYFYRLETEHGVHSGSMVKAR